MARPDSALLSSVSVAPLAWKMSRRTTVVPAASGPATLVQTQAMNQDYQQVMKPEVSNLMGLAFRTLQRDPTRAKFTELVTVSNETGYQNGLIWFHPDSASHSGWAHESSNIYSAPQQYGQPMVPTMLLPFYQGDTLFVFAEYENPPGTAGSQLLGMQRTQQNGWEQAVMASNALLGTLQTMDQSDLFFDQDGQGYLYGVSCGDPNQLELVVVGLEAGAGLTSLGSFPAVDGTTYKLLPGAQAGAFVALQLQGSVATFQAGTISDNGITLVGGPASHDLGVGDLAADTVVPILGGVSGQPAFLLLAQNQQLYLVTGNGLNGSQPATAVQVTGATDGTQPTALISITGGSQPDGSGFTAFGLDTTSNQLWMLAPPTPGADYGWVQMGNTGIAIAAPTYLAGGPELFLCDPATVVSHITQRATTGSWFTLPIAVPSPSTQPINETASFTQQFTLTSAAGVPMGNEVLSVYANPAQVLVVNNIAYNASPSQPAVIRTNGAGSVVIASVATGLASPVLTVTGDALQNNAPGSVPPPGTVPPGYRGDTQLHQRIAGQGGFSYNGQSLITGGVLPANTSSSDADQLATNLQQTSGVAVNIANGGSGDAARPKTAFTMEIKGKRLHSRAITPEEFARKIGDADSIVGDAWGDVAHFCKQAWNDIESITVEIAEITATIIVNGTHFLLQTIDDIRDALEVMLQFCVRLWDDVVDVIKLFIEFIKLLFDWGNILNTKKVLRYTVEQLLQDLQKSDSGAIQWINKQFTALGNDINSYFGQLEGVIGGTTFRDASQGSAPVQQQSQANAVQNNYITSKAVAPMPALDSPVQGGFDPDSAWQDVQTAFGTAFENSKTEIEQSWDQLSQFMDQVDSLSTFLDLAILGFLDACQDLAYIAVQAIQAVVDTILGLMAGAVASISELMTRTIDIPVLSGLYKLISGDEPLTLLDLVCLAVAVPATIAYDILHDAPPFSSSWMAQFEPPNHPPPILWPWNEGSRDPAGPLAVHPMLLSKGETPVEIIAAAAAGCYFICDVIADCANTGSSTSADEFWLKPVSALGLVSGLVGLCFGQPWYAPRPSASPAAGMEMGTFAFGAVPWLLDTIFFCGQRKLSRFATEEKLANYGIYMSCACGAVQMAAGVATCVMMAEHTTAGTYDYSIADEMAGIFSGVSNVGKPFVKIDEWGYIITIIFDMAGDIGSLFLDVFADTK